MERKELQKVVKGVFCSKDPTREVSEDDIETVLKVMDRNHDGKVSRDELFVVIKNLNN